MSRPHGWKVGPGGLRSGFERLGPLPLLAFLPITFLVWGAVSAFHRGFIGIDFTTELYPEAKAVLHGHNPLPAPDADLTISSNRSVFPIPTALLFTPFTLLPMGPASGVWAVCLLAALAGALWAMDVRDWRVYGVIVLWPATIEGLQTGNLSILMALLTALAWRWRDHRLLPGVCVGMVIALKLFLWPLVFWLIAIRRFGAAAVAVGIAAVGLLLILPYQSLGEYGRLMNNLGEKFGPRSYNPVGLLTQSDVSGYHVAQVVASIAGIVVLALAMHRRSITLTLAASLLLSPIVWIHYFVLLLIPLALYSPRFSRIWLVPLVLWICPGNGIDVRLHHVVIALVVLAAVTFVTETRPPVQPHPVYG